MHIGFAFDVPASAEVGASVAAEYEDQQTIKWLRTTLSQLGKVTDLPWGSDFSSRLYNASPDVLFNITEARGGRNRESLVPAIAESLGISYTGSDALALGLSLHKGFAKTIASSIGIPCPNGYIVSPSSGESIPPSLSFPAIVKPLSGGSSMGITQDSKVADAEALDTIIDLTMEACGDGVIVEEFIRGREFAVAIVDLGSGPVVLPVAEIVLNDGDPDAFYSIDLKSVHSKKLICPAKIDADLGARMAEYGMNIFTAMGCRDLARIDFRLSQEGTVQFLEINPLPGLSPYYGIYPVQAAAGGIPAEKIVHQLVTNALNRNEEQIFHA